MVHKSNSHNMSKIFRLLKQVVNWIFKFSDPPEIEPTRMSRPNLRVRIRSTTGTCFQKNNINDLRCGEYIKGRWNSQPVSRVNIVLQEWICVRCSNGISLFDGLIFTSVRCEKSNVQYIVTNSATLEDFNVVSSEELLWAERRHANTKAATNTYCHEEKWLFEDILWCYFQYFDLYFRERIISWTHPNCAYISSDINQTWSCCVFRHFWGKIWLENLPKKNV